MPGLGDVEGSTKEKDDASRMEWQEIDWYACEIRRKNHIIDTFLQIRYSFLTLNVNLLFSHVHPVRVKNHFERQPH